MGRQLAPLFTIFTVKSGALSDIYLLTIFMTQGLLVFFLCSKYDGDYCVAKCHINAKYAHFQWATLYTNILFTFYHFPAVLLFPFVSFV